MVVKLIAKDRFEKLQYEGRCKLVIDSLSKLLLVEPFIEEYKMISAMFKWEFVAQKNILFVFAEHEFQDFALVFDDTNKCQKIYGFLMKKGATPGEKELIQKRFFPAMFKSISIDSQKTTPMKEIFVDWFKKYDDEKEKQELIQMLKEYNVYDLLLHSNSEENNRKNLRKRKAKNAVSREDNNNAFNNIKSKNINSKRQFFESKNFQQTQSSFSKKFVEAPNFKILKYFKNDILRIELQIFPLFNNKQLCYEYIWSEKRKIFYCWECFRKRKCVTAKIVKRNEKDDAIQQNDNEHVCELKECKKIIEKSNFDIVSHEYGKGVKKRLIIFLDSSRSKCYEYEWHNFLQYYSCYGCSLKKYRTAAYICQKEEDGTEFVMLKSKKHVCEIRQFNPEKYGEKKIIEAEDFKIFKQSKDGIDQSKLVIFTSSDKKYCYEYFWNNTAKTFDCCGCRRKKKHVTAELCCHQNSDESEYLKLSKWKHICDPREYNPKKYEASNKIVEKPNFKLFHYQHRGTPTTKLIVFCETNKNLCYEYYPQKIRQRYFCSFCPLQKQVSAELLCHDDGTKDYVILSNAEHVCDLREFIPERFKDDAIIRKPMYNITATTLRSTKYKVLNIFVNNEMKHYYQFHYKNEAYKKYYCCYKCFTSKLLITAVIKNEGKENEFIYLSNQKHICEPYEFFSLTNGNIIVAPNFQIINRKVKSKIRKRLVVFTNDAKTECFEYTWAGEKQNHFICLKCDSQYKTFIYAKMFKNDENEDCIELGQNPHKCNPIKFIPEDMDSPKIVKKPHFKIWEEISKKRNIKKLSISDPINKHMGYIYSYQEYRKIFVCYKCREKGKHVTAKLLQDENDQDYVEIGKIEHICELQKMYN